MKASKNISFIIAVIFALFMASCSNTRFLTDDKILYIGNEIELQGEKKDKEIKKAKEIASEVTFKEPNNSLMGKRFLPPVGLWYYNYRKPEEGKRGGFLYRTLKKDPILVSDVNPDLRVQKIESELFANGFFTSDVTFKLDSAGKDKRKAKIIYSLKVGHPYRLAQILTPQAIDSVDVLINSFSKNLNLKPGDVFNLEAIRNEKQKLAVMMVDSGYYFFSPNEIEVVADTVESLNSVNLLFRKATDIKPYILKKYSISEVMVNVKTLARETGEPLFNDTIFHDGVYITGQTDYLKPDVITRSILFREGDLYSDFKHRGTIPLLNNYGVFQSVKMQFALSDSANQKMNVLHELTPKNDVTLSFEGAVQAKSTGFAGPVSEITLAQANLLKGANRFQIKLNGGFEWQWGKKGEEELSGNSYHYGINSSLAFPKMIVPFKSVRNNKTIIGKTIISLGLEFKNDIKYYRMYSTNLSFGYQWRINKKISHQLKPLKINFITLLETTSLFDSIVESNPYVKRSFEEQQIIGPEYSFTYDNSGRRNGFYFQGILSSSGNLIDALMQISKKERPYLLFGDPYSQFIKLSTDIRYYTGTNKEGIVMRFYAGTGLSYGNSSVMPYVEQFFSGGSNSLRGFVARSVGPGSYKPEVYNGIIDQTGDIKLELNAEYRFRMSEIMFGALFMETGNVWLMNPDENRPGANFNFNTFTKQLAVSSGFGLRFDFDFFILRTDVGLPLRRSYNDGRGYWNDFNTVFSKFRFNLAIGYPF